ncbi:MAG TPA: SDR family NAD(P)-dependent oxidoreductase [Gemmatimonadales bacterium]|jgi:NAD(P)-dependent dehydrogenase (short-subunit alcohol dehydrogenase family)
MAVESSAQVAVVTGGSRGIGRAVVEALLGRGWRVFLCSQHPESTARALEELAATAPGRVAGRAVDVRRQEEVDGFVAWVLAEAGRIDLLVNNAGQGTFGAVDALSGDDFRAVVETNLCGPFYFLRAVAPAMRRQGSGWIVNVASLAGKNAMAGGAAYNASKFGLVGLSEAAMLDLRQDGVRVAAILPGSVSTDFSHPDGRQAGRDWRLAPEDVAEAVVGLLAYPPRALPSLIELRPSHPPRK